MPIFFLSFGLGPIGALAGDISAAKGAAVEIFSLVDRRPAIDVQAAGKRLQKVNGRLEFRNVSFSYPARPELQIFKKMSLDIAAGQNLAIVGFSGGGKSTLIALLERFYDPVEGGVFLDGVDLRTLDVSWLRKCIGLIAQEPVLFGGTIGDNIAYGKPEATRSEIIAAAQDANAHRFIDQLPAGYDTDLGSDVTQLCLWPHVVKG